ncbi:MAG: hypothetical protein ACRD2X_08360 [Vicinamibacteraceae bacterium]
MGSTLLAALLATLVACAPLYIAPSQRAPAEADAAPAEGVVYAFGDMGAPTPGLADVATAMSKELAADHTRGGLRESPLLLALGDNLYEAGLPRPQTGDTAPIRRLGRIADLLGKCRFGERPAPLVLVPGNHDYADGALPREREVGDITRWYYLDRLGIGGVSHWTMLPGERPNDVRDATKLYERLYNAPEEQLAEFMRPRRIPHTPASLAIIAIDSQLLIDLFAAGRDDLANRYLAALESELEQAASARWRLVASHHPVGSYGAHHVTLPARFLLGPGWRQLRSPWEVVLAIPPLGALATTARWAVASNQDFHASANRAYRHSLLERLERHRAALVLSGHDHNSQLIELDSSEGSRPILQVVSGAAAKVDPVTRGDGTLFYHSGHGYTRLAVHATHLEVAFKDRSGATLFRYRLGE